MVCDVSFIGLAKALPAALALAAPDADLVALVKPQFEVGPEGVGKGGVVRDEAARAGALAAVKAFLDAAGWPVQESGCRQPHRGRRWPSRVPALGEKRPPALTRTAEVG